MALSEIKIPEDKWKEIATMEILGMRNIWLEINTRTFRRLQRRLCCGSISSYEADEAVIKNLCKYSYFL
jgi:hypothetical protein